MQKAGKILAISLAVGLVILGLLLVMSRPAQDRAFFDLEGPLVIAHQGGEGLRPSNTMASFQHAMDLGVDVLEMDVHSSADGVLVLIHDDTVDRTTDGTGRVHDLTFEQLQMLDAGEYWTDDEGATYPYRGQDIRIPALEEVLAAFPDIPVNIEIKQVDPSIAGDLCRLLRQYDMTGRALIASFHAESMNEFRNLCPEVATSMVESEIRAFYILSRLGLSSLYSPPGQAFRVPESSGNIEILTQSFIDASQAGNIAVHAWTINESADMARLLNMGLDGIITDRPDRMLELLGR